MYNWNCSINKNSTVLQCAVWLLSALFLLSFPCSCDHLPQHEGWSSDRLVHRLLHPPVCRHQGRCQCSLRLCVQKWSRCSGGWAWALSCSLWVKFSATVRSQHSITLCWWLGVWAQTIYTYVPDFFFLLAQMQVRELILSMCHFQESDSRFCPVFFSKNKVKTPKAEHFSHVSHCSHWRGKMSHGLKILFL